MSTAYHNLMKRQSVKSILREAFACAREFFDYTDILYERIEKTEAKTIGPQRFITPLSVKARVQMRFLKDGKKVNIKVGDLKAEALCAAVERARGLWRTVRKPRVPVRLAPIPNVKRKTYAINAREDVRNADPAKVIKAVLTGVRRIADSFERRHADRGLAINPEVWFYTQREEKIIADSEGVYKTQRMPRTFLQVHTKLSDNKGRKTQTRVRIAEIAGLETLLDSTKTGWKLNKSTQAQVKDWMNKAIELLDGRFLAADEIARMDHFILDYNTLGVFIHEALGHNFEADSVKAGTSAVADSKGKPLGVVAAETFHIVDGPPIDLKTGKPSFKTGYGTELIDDEGVEVKVKYLARNGKVTGFIHNRETAAYFGQEPNGGAYSQLGDEQICRMSNTYLVPADPSIVRKDLDDLLKEIKYGLILQGTLGGAVSKDGMSSSIQIGYLIEQGKITGAVNPANFSGKSMYALRYIDACAGQLRVDDVGFCGKGGQHRPVGDGGPRWTRIKTNEYVKLSIQGGSDVR